MNRLRPLLIRGEKKLENFMALLHLAGAYIAWHLACAYVAWHLAGAYVAWHLACACIAWHLACAYVVRWNWPVSDRL